MKRVLITGATGFIGHPCLKHLIGRDFEVHALTSSREKVPAPLASEGIEWHHADLLDSARVQEVISKALPTHLLHLAWYVAPGMYPSEENLKWVQASLNLLTTFKELGGKRVVMAGSGFEYDWRYGYCSEFVTPTVPNTFYGSCKHALHLLLQSYTNVARLSSAWGRIFWLYGPRESPTRLVPSVICSLLQSQPAKCSHGEQIRDFLHVDDVARALVVLLDSDVKGPVNIASGRPVAVKQVILKIAEIVGNPELVQLGAIPVQSHEAPFVVADTGRLQRELDWVPKYDLERGLADTINWWKTELFSEEKSYTYHE